MGGLKRLIFFLNPRAGLGSLDAFRREAHAGLWGYRLEFRVPDGLAELRRQCAELSPHNCAAAVIVGGDGSICSALPGLQKSGVPFFPYPTGTANDLATELRCRSSFALLQFLVDKHCVKELDVLAVNGTPFVTVGGLGIVSKLLCEFNERRIASRSYLRFVRLWGPKMYTYLAAKSLLWSPEEARTLRLSSAEFQGSLETIVLLACNQARLGSSTAVAPAALNNDGLMDILALTHTRPHRTLPALAALRRGEDPSESVRFQTKRLEVEDELGRELVFFGDGEILCRAKKLILEVLPQRVKVFAGSAETDALFL